MSLHYTFIPPLIKQSVVSTALKVMKPEETPERWSIIVEMLRASDYNTKERITTFVKATVPHDCQEMIKKLLSFENCD